MSRLLFLAFHIVSHFKQKIILLPRNCSKHFININYLSPPESSEIVTMITSILHMGVLTQVGRTSHPPSQVVDSRAEIQSWDPSCYSPLGLLLRINTGRPPECMGRFRVEQCVQSDLIFTTFMVVVTVEGERDLVIVV